MPDPSGSLGHRQSQGTRWEAALQQFVSLRDRVVVAVSLVRRNGPRVFQITAVGFRFRDNRNVDSMIDAFEQLQTLGSQINAFTLRGI